MDGLPRIWFYGAVGEGLVAALYEIRTYKGGRTSLITMAIHANDVEAIIAARDLLRKDESVEVWRDDTLVYRTVPRLEQKKKTPKPASRL